MSTVQFYVTNNTGNALDGMAIFVYALPLPSQYPLYSSLPYRTLRPGNGSTSPFAWSGVVGGRTLSPDGTVSAVVTIPADQLSLAVSEGGLTPTLTPPAPSTMVAAGNSGMQNTTVPYQPFNALWCVDTVKVAKSVSAVTASSISQFGLVPATYWGVSPSALTSPDQIGSTCVPYTAPAGAGTVEVSVTFNPTTGLFVFTFTPS